METTPRFLRGIHSFTGGGLSSPAPLDHGMSYTVSSDKRAQIVYLRAGNSADAMIAITLTLDGKPFRMFPIGAKGAVHVPLALVEDLEPDSKLELLVAAQAGVSGEVAVELGFIEI